MIPTEFLCHTESSLDQEWLMRYQQAWDNEKTRPQQEGRHPDILKPYSLDKALLIELNRQKVCNLNMLWR